METAKQKTLKGSFSLFGKGLHTGLSLTVVFNPAPENSGYKIQRTDLDGAPIIDAVAEKVIDTLSDTMFEVFKRKMDRLAEVANPVIKRVYEEQGNQYEKILIPITDGRRQYNIPVDLKAAYESDSKEVIKAFEKALLLLNIDEGWKENLRALDDLKTAVQNATYEQKDPLVIYKLESFNLFTRMTTDCNRKITEILMRAQIPVRESDPVRRAEEARHKDYSKYNTQKQDMSDIQRAGNKDTREQQVTQPIHVEKTVGRNDPCPCGSGKKYKNCHGKNA